MEALVLTQTTYVSLTHIIGENLDLASTPGAELAPEAVFLPTIDIDTCVAQIRFFLNLVLLFVLLSLTSTIGEPSLLTFMDACVLLLVVEGHVFSPILFSSSARSRAVVVGPEDGTQRRKTHPMPICACFPCILPTGNGMWWQELGFCVTTFNRVRSGITCSARRSPRSGTPGRGSKGSERSCFHGTEHLRYTATTSHFSCLLSVVGTMKSQVSSRRAAITVVHRSNAIDIRP